MTLRIETSRIAIIAAMAAFSMPAAAQTNHLIPNGTTDAAQKTVAGTDTITVQAGGTLETTTNPAINWNDASTGLVIDNGGTIRTTNASGRAINASGGNNARSITLTNRAGGLIESADDAFRINVDPSAGTIIVNNAGIIRTTLAGQALDFDAIATGGASVTINNLAGAELRSTGQDAVRPGQGAVVTNAGLIRSDGVPNSSFDGIDWQLRSGIVINQAGGVISGLRHGITSDTRVDVTNEAGATISGRNGSGVGSDGDGIVVNRGTITGQWDGVATNGDGDGVDIDLVGTVRNYGTIQGLSAAGVDSGGQPNNAQGIAMGGGLIENFAGASIIGGADAILIDDGSGGGGYGATSIVNAGSITGNTGAGIVLVGDFADSITNSGTISGGNGTAISMGGGNDTLTVQGGAVFTGAIDGGNGTDRIVFNTGNGSFAGAVNFEQVAVQSGQWSLTGALTANSYQVEAGATLTSTMSATIASTTTPLAITNSGTISSTNATGRAINIAGSNNARDITITNNAGAVIQSADDAVRVNFNPTGGTITVNNSGVIKTTVGGQAIDFDAAASGSATIVINNLAGGELRSFGQDAIRPGQGATVTNVGLIFSDGPANNSYDGVDWQGKSGKVINQAGGVISGLRHGITSDVNVDVVNAAGATITGRNGSGVGSDGTGIVANHGTITGSWDGVATNGDGDGVDIDLIGTVRNFGTIRGISATGVDSGGRPNSAQGIAMGGGVIENAAGALISGGRSGILIDDGADNTAYGATTITNGGTIEGLAGPAIALVGNFNDGMTNSGTIRGVGTAIQMGGGDDVLTLLPGSVITGTVDGGAGTDRVTLAGSGNGSFAGSVNFEQLAVDSGSWTLTGNSSFTQSTIAAGATLTGTTAVLTGGIANAGALKIDQAFSGTLAAVLSGAGTLQKLGTGTLDIGTLGGFNGPIQVQGGRLNMLGTSASAVTVGSGATLGGTGSVGSVTVQSGGTISPGTSIGTLTVTGNLTQATGSTYAAEIAVGSNDRIAVGGAAAIQTGTTLAVTRAAGAYAIGSRYTLLTATGGVNGNYGSLTQNAVGDTELRLGATSNSIFVDVARTGASLVKLGGTPNQIAVATAFGTLNAGNAAYAVLTLNPDDAALRAAFNLLSGEIHASIGTAMVQNAISAQSAIASRFGLDAEGTSIWGQFVGATGEDEGVFASGDADSDTIGGMGGVDLGLGEVRIGLAGGHTRDKLRVADRLSSATLRTAHLLAYAGGRFGGVSLRGGIGYGWTSVDTRRSIVFTGFSDQTAASYDGSTLHGFAELGVPVPLKDAMIEPFAGVAAYRVKTDAFAETGGAALLRGAGRSDTFALGKLGLRATLPITGNVSGGGSIAWQHMFGELGSFGRFGFGAAPTTFDIAGTALSRNAAAAAITLNWHVGGGTTLSFGYDGLIGEYGSRSNGRISLSVVF